MDKTFRYTCDDCGTLFIIELGQTINGIHVEGPATAMEAAGLKKSDDGLIRCVDCRHPKDYELV